MNKLVYAFFCLVTFFVSKIDCQEKIIKEINLSINNLNDLESFKDSPADTKKLLEIVHELEEKGSFEIIGEDSEVRPIFVTMQSVFEEVLSNQLKKNVSLLAGIILGYGPPTPLYFSFEDPATLVSKKIQNHPQSLATIKARQKILDEYLKQGGILYALYTQKGYESLTNQEKEIFKKNIDTYSTQLISKALPIENIPDNLVGAIYYFSCKDLKTYAFAIEMPQASYPEKKSSYKLYLGEITDKLIEERMNAIMQFINSEPS
jgi:hypothetical protein